MRILHLIIGLEDGGAEAVLYRLVDSDKDNYHHVVSLTGPGKYGPLLEEKGIKVTVINMPSRKLTISGLLLLWNTISEAKIDVVQTWMYHADLIGGIICRIKNIPVIWNILSTKIDCGKTLSTSVYLVKICALLSQFIPSRIIICAHKAKEIHSEFGFSTDRMAVITNGYDLERFMPDQTARNILRSEWGIPESMPLIGVVARYHPQKDYPNFISALRLLRNRGVEFRVIMVGAGVVSGQFMLDKLLMENGLVSITRLLGPRNDIPAVMNALDILVLSSTEEAFPNVIAEAMACGVPCVSTNVGDANLIIGSTGWIVPPKNPVRLAKAIQSALYLWQNKSEWKQLKIASRSSIVENYDIKYMAKKYRDEWKNACS